MIGSRGKQLNRADLTTMLKADGIVFLSQYENTQKSNPTRLCATKPLGLERLKISLA